MDNIIDRLAGTELDGCVTKDSEGFYFRYDFPESDPDESWEEYIFISSILDAHGLYLCDSCTEHDCISGEVRDVTRDLLKEEVGKIEAERKSN